MRGSHEAPDQSTAAATQPDGGQTRLYSAGRAFVEEIKAAVSGRALTPAETALVFSQIDAACCVLARISPASILRPEPFRGMIEMLRPDVPETLVTSGADRAALGELRVRRARIYLDRISELNQIMSANLRLACSQYASAGEWPVWARNELLRVRLAWNIVMLRCYGVAYRLGFAVNVEPALGRLFGKGVAGGFD